MQKIFLFIILFFCGLNAAIINDSIDLNDSISLDDLSKYKVFKVINMIVGPGIVKMHCLNLNSIEGIENLKLIYEGRYILSQKLIGDERFIAIIKIDNLELYLNNNQIADISNLNFLSNLSKLDLSNNNLTQLPELTLPNLKYLNLSNNQIEYISSLSHLTRLFQLNLSNNRLIIIEELYLPWLRYLDLSNNRLIYIHNLAISDLSEVDLSNNQLEKLPNFNRAFNLRKLNLSSNRLTSNIKLPWFLKYLQLNIYNNNIRIYREKLQNGKIVIRVMDHDESINHELTVILTKFAKNNTLTFEPSNTDFIFNQLPEDIKRYYISPLLSDSIPRHYC